MRIDLIGQPYQGKSVIVSGQEVVNLYAENNAGDPKAPVPITYYQTPGWAVWANPENELPVRATYRTSIGTAYVVVGSSLYFLTSLQTLIFIGFVADRPSQVIMADNGLVVILADGVNGYVIDMATNLFGQILDPNFYSPSYCFYLDTFFGFNRVGTNQFFITSSMANYGMLTNTAIEDGVIVGGSLYTNATYLNVPLTGGSGTGALANVTVAGNTVTIVDIVDGGYNYLLSDVLSANAADIGGTGSGFTYTVDIMQSAFDPLDIAAKAGSADPIVAIMTVHKDLWLIGELTTEVWIGTGAADFYFQRQQGAYIDHGCAAEYSVACQDVVLFWLMQDKQGSGIVLKGTGYDVTEISTPRLVSLFKQYSTIEDAIGFCFQIEDHSFYCLIFPTANKTWLYDLATGYWSEWDWADENGNLNRHRANCGMFVYDKNLIGDWENGKILELDPQLYQDGNNPIIRIRTFAHLVEDGNRVTYNQFTADITVGTSNQTDVDEEAPTVGLLWSDNRGVSYGNRVSQTLGKEGDYLVQPSWNRLGMARDRVFKLTWSANADVSLNGAWIDAVAHGS